MPPVPLPPTPVALITGASRGIGRAAALALAKAGYRLALVARTRAHLEETARLAGLDAAAHAESALLLPADVADAGACKKAVEAAARHFGRLDALVHCAGVAPLKPLEQTTDEDWRAALDTNLSAAFHLTRAAWPHLKAAAAPAAGGPVGTVAGGAIAPLAGEGGAAAPLAGEGAAEPMAASATLPPAGQPAAAVTGRGHAAVVLISSLSSRDPFPGFAAYGAAKAGVNLFALAAAREGLPHRIHVHAVAPGAVETDMFRAIATPEQWPSEKTLSPTDVADVILQCADGRLRHTSGEVIYLHKTI